MRSGLLRHEINVQTDTPSVDAMGGASQSWATTTTIWARIEPISGTEDFNDDQTEATLTHRVTIRGDDAVGTVKRIKFGSRYFEVHGVRDKDERGIEKILLCEETPAP